ncbi:MAG TPA: cupredoxin domain-containing protein [Candidatus Binatia bacterium]|nr:cupredoxin domain-containing protein [Candidatus Binatia bacterium]
MPKRIGMGIAAAVAAAAILAIAASWRERVPPGPVETVALSMKDYTFNGRNPTLRFAPGQRVRFVVSNDEDTRVLHNFRIAGLGVPCGPPLLPGERREVTVTLPRSGTFAYTCCTHPGMGGKLVIAAR